MELFADIFNAMKAELRTAFRGCTFTLVRATKTHTAWRGEGQSAPFIAVRESNGAIYVDAKYDWNKE